MKLKKNSFIQAFFYNEVYTLSWACHSNMNSPVLIASEQKTHVNRNKHNTTQLACLQTLV